MPLASLMRWLLTGYTVTFNRRHRRHGQLFQNRYKSVVCQEDIYLKELVCYIRLNPMRAGLVSDLGKLNGYPYCGHSAVMGVIERSWQTVGPVLRYFGKTVPGARKAYSYYLEARMVQGHREDLTGGGLIRSLGETAVKRPASAVRIIIRVMRESWETRTSWKTFPPFPGSTTNAGTI